jgi:group I intron endonuclease
MYIGSSINLRVRLYTYYSIGSLTNKKDRLINRALLKYGFENFRFEILEYCTKDVILEREQYYLDLFKPIYNIVSQAGNTLGYKHSEETKKE